jgi:hypothetical protein
MIQKPRCVERENLNMLHNSMFNAILACVKGVVGRGVGSAHVNKAGYEVIGGVVAKTEGRFDPVTQSDGLKAGRMGLTWVEAGEAGQGLKSRVEITWGCTRGCPAVFPPLLNT